LRHILADIRADDLRAHAVIRRLRALLERHETARQPVDVHAALADTVRLVAGEAQRRRVRIELVAGASRATVQADPVQVQQVVLNLVLNAMDAMSATPIERRTVAVATRDGDGCIEVTVSDRGHGLRGQDAERLFDSFFTTKPHGMGLGLSIARSIVQAHHGRIAAAPRPGGGAVFTLHLPTDPHVKPVSAEPGRRPRSPRAPRSAAVA
jgi:signal transduction histidine kinase